MTDDIDIFSKQETSIADIEAAGWFMYASSSGDSWWKHRETGRNFMPFWLRQMVHSASNSGAESVRHELRELLHVPHPKKQRKPASRFEAARQRELKRTQGAK